MYGSEALFCEHPTDPSNRPDEHSYIGCSSLGPLLTDLFLLDEAAKISGI